MSRVATLYGSLLSLTLLAIPVCDADGAIASEKLLPDTTKGYFSVPSIDQLRTKWRETQLGQMANDPAMKPFADDLRAQLRAKLEQNVAQIGLTWEDVDAVHNGEVCLAMIQPGGDPTKHAVAVLVDVTDRADATGQLLAKVEATMKERGASQRTRKAGRHGDHRLFHSGQKRQIEAASRLPVRETTDVGRGKRRERGDGDRGPP